MVDRETSFERLCEVYIFVDYRWQPKSSPTMHSMNLSNMRSLHNSAKEVVIKHYASELSLAIDESELNVHGLCYYARGGKVGKAHEIKNDKDAFMAIAEYSGLLDDRGNKMDDHMIRLGIHFNLVGDKGNSHPTVAKCLNIKSESDEHEEATTNCHKPTYNSSEYAKSDEPYNWYCHKFMATLRHLQRYRVYCTVTLVARSGEVVYVHDVIIAAAMPNFRGMLKRNRSCTIKVDLSFKVLTHVVDFMYGDKINFDYIPFDDMVDAAKKLKFDLLMKFCDAVPTGNLPPDEEDFPVTSSIVPTIVTNDDVAMDTSPIGDMSPRPGISPAAAASPGATTDSRHVTAAFAEDDIITPPQQPAVSHVMRRLSRQKAVDTSEQAPPTQIAIKQELDLDADDGTFPFEERPRIDDQSALVPRMSLTQSNDELDSRSDTASSKNPFKISELRRKTWYIPQTMEYLEHLKKTYRCISCRKVFQSKTVLTKHTEKTHLLTTSNDLLCYEDFFCDCCGVYFLSRQDYMLHTANQHPNYGPCFDPPVKCEESGCQMRFTNKLSWWTHTQEHSRKNVYVCLLPGCQFRGSLSTVFNHEKLAHGDARHPLRKSGSADRADLRPARRAPSPEAVGDSARTLAPARDSPPHVRRAGAVPGSVWEEKMQVLRASAEELDKMYMEGMHGGADESRAPDADDDDEVTAGPAISTAFGKANSEHADAVYANATSEQPPAPPQPTVSNTLLDQLLRYGEKQRKQLEAEQQQQQYAPQPTPIVVEPQPMLRVLDVDGHRISPMSDPELLVRRPKRGRPPKDRSLDKLIAARTPVQQPCAEYTKDDSALLRLPRKRGRHSKYAAKIHALKQASRASEDASQLLSASSILKATHSLSSSEELSVDLPDYGALPTDSAEKFATGGGEDVVHAGAWFLPQTTEFLSQLCEETKCFTCQKIFHSQDSLARHITQAHSQAMATDAEDYYCPHCHVYFVSRAVFMLHVSNQHPGLEPETSGPVNCPVCRQIFTRKFMFWRHRYSEDGPCRTQHIMWPCIHGGCSFENMERSLVRKHEQTDHNDLSLTPSNVRRLISRLAHPISPVSPASSPSHDVTGQQPSEMHLTPGKACSSRKRKMHVTSEEPMQAPPEVSVTQPPDDPPPEEPTYWKCQYCLKYIELSKKVQHLWFKHKKGSDDSSEERSEDRSGSSFGSFASGLSLTSIDENPDK